MTENVNIQREAWQKELAKLEENHAQLLSLPEPPGHHKPLRTERIIQLKRWLNEDVPVAPAPTASAREWQKQLITGDRGDCLRAAFANCLGLPVESLPHYENDAWFDKWARWFRERGIGLVWYGFRPEIQYGFPGLYVLSVKSPRLEGRTHCVVAKDGSIVFDPHPQADETPCDPNTANGAYLFHLLDASSQSEKLKGVGQQAAEEIRKYVKATGLRASSRTAADIIDRVIAGRVKP